MTYSESAEGVTITKARAFKELDAHGYVRDETGLDEFYAECGNRREYMADDVLQFLGY